MAGIEQFAGLSSNAQKINKNGSAKKALDKEPSKIKPVRNSKISSGKDEPNISKTAKNLLSLKIEVQKFIDEVKESKTITDSEVQAVRKKMEEKYYFNSKVIDEVINKILSLPGFQQKT
jgi:hypothetical protein